jgi:hypothetical protein
VVLAAPRPGDAAGPLTSRSTPTATVPGMPPWMSGTCRFRGTGPRLPQCPVTAQGAPQQRLTPVFREVTEIRKGGGGSGERTPTRPPGILGNLGTGDQGPRITDSRTKGYTHYRRLPILGNYLVNGNHTSVFVGRSHRAFLPPSPARRAAQFPGPGPSSEASSVCATHSDVARWIRLPPAMCIASSASTRPIASGELGDGLAQLRRLEQPARDVCPDPLVRMGGTRQRGEALGHHVPPGRPSRVNAQRGRG